ncbi:MAG: bifunctional riboflavin kinase/FMN adenylyltransferase [Planctomycetota bacterium]
MVTIGTFDGAHRGHRSLIERCIAAAKRHEAQRGERVETVALVFDPHPMTHVRPERAPARLTTFERRRDLLRSMGADRVVRLEPTGSVMSRPPGAFIDWLVEELTPIMIVEGPDFRFGKGRAGDVRTLAELGAARSPEQRFEVEVAPELRVALGDHHVVRASSSLVRALLADGRVLDAAMVLGRPYELDGVVVRGDRRGRTIGYPTANVQTDCLLPSDGVYAGWVDGRNAAGVERRFPAAISVGRKPTFHETTPVCEAFLLDAERDEQRIVGFDEYGWSIRVSFVGWLRDQVKFEGVEPLLDQMARDCERARAALGLPHSLVGTEAT